MGAYAANQPAQGCFLVNIGCGKAVSCNGGRHLPAMPTLLVVLGQLSVHK
jgi:hypothetical protein